MPFQRWFKFKEAFAPSMVMECINRLNYKPVTCLDPFGGCGTTAITCQFSGIAPTLIEVNPFIADLAEAKLAKYDLDSLQEDYLAVRKCVRQGKISSPLEYFPNAPATLCEPGLRGRWVYSSEVLSRILGYREAINALSNETNARLLRVLLGSILVETSNVVVNGKGRKYRNNWKLRQKSIDDVDKYFERACLFAFEDLQIFSERNLQQYQIYRGSCLDEIDSVGPVDCCIFSPPYPNSFDYTDIYNLELWVLGYLGDKADNTCLRTQTLRSHVQVALPKRGYPGRSITLDNVVEELAQKREQLWDPRIPEMVSGYFSDLQLLFDKMHNKVRPGGGVFAVVGDSSYSGVTVPVGEILSEIASDIGYDLKSLESIRKMRVSAQQGGQKDLHETLVHLTA